MTIYYWSYIWRRSQTSWGAGVLLLNHPFSIFSCFSLFLLLSWFYALDSCLFHFFSYVIMCEHLYIVIAVILIYYSDYIACSGYFKLSACVWSIFSRVYMSPTLVATLFSCILGSGVWQDFLGIRARFDIKRGHSSYLWPDTCYIYITINIYYSHDDIEPTWELIVLLWVSISLIL